MRLIVTGGAGFIGSAVVRHLVRRTDMDVMNVDSLTYAGNLESLTKSASSPRYTFQRADIRDAAAMAQLFNEFRPDAVMHLAAETHVDRSIDGPANFVDTNISGTFTLLEAARRYWSALEGDARARFRFHHVSTDEVYGSLGADGLFTEESPYNPSSPYSASKAAADHLVRAWHATYGLPVIVSNTSNNFGPYQYPEKLIPLVINAALSGKGLPVYGTGANVRDWLYVEDHAEALVAVVTKGVVGETYNIGATAERTNLDVVRQICSILDRVNPRADGRSYAGQISFVTDRPGHDHRYALDASKIARELGWRPRHSFEDALAITVRWYIGNQDWCRRIGANHYDGERLGLTQDVASIAARDSRVP